MKRVFLGGTCNESTWRACIIPLLAIEYFDPVVEDWTEECLAREIEERQNCDFCLYTITPKMIGVYTIAEVVDDSNKRPSKTILVTLQNSIDGLEFSTTQWKHLGRVAEMVKSNGGQVFDNLEDAAQYMNLS